ncbi:hypothetical protein EIP91_004096 [Steccherinum ochraceum]|uniref:Uncharacterized protein n=1 Tax=Steccherinum ochraceum TaxID=92696 RepID=A0A4R0RFL7_9APHY|nr:hypothetical protein EIP91_004096 [Steccherinum ochraceum]
MSEREIIEKQIAYHITALALLRRNLYTLVTPIGKLPLELLLQIFRGCADRISLKLDTPCTAPLALLQVCYHWREAALSFPELWTSIQTTTLVSDASYLHFARQLAWSQQLALHIDLDNRADWLFPSGSRRIFELLQPNMKRIESLTLHLTHGEFVEARSVIFLAFGPLLHTFQLNICTVRRPDELIQTSFKPFFPLDRPGHDSPYLQRLHLTDTLLTWTDDSSFPRSLTSLSLKRTYQCSPHNPFQEPSWTTVVSAIEQLPFLTNLELCDMLPQFPSRYNSPWPVPAIRITMPRLRNLRLSDNIWKSVFFLDHITIPPMIAVHLQFTGSLADITEMHHIVPCLVAKAGLTDHSSGADLSPFKLVVDKTTIVACKPHVSFENQVDLQTLDRYITEDSQAVLFSLSLEQVESSYNVDPLASFISEVCPLLWISLASELQIREDACVDINPLVNMHLLRERESAWRALLDCMPNLHSLDVKGPLRLPTVLSARSSLARGSASSACPAPRLQHFNMESMQLRVESGSGRASRLWATPQDWRDLFKSRKAAGCGDARLRMRYTRMEPTDLALLQEAAEVIMYYGNTSE